MPDPFDLSNPTAGMLSVNVGNGSAVEIDAFEINNRIVELQSEFEEKPLHEFHTAIVALMVEKGLPTMTHFKVAQFMEYIAGAVRELEGKVEPATGSPAASRDSTDSTASTGAEAPADDSSSPATPPISTV